MPVAPQYEVVPYSIADLKRLLGNERCPPDVIEGKLHSIYFDEYFRELKAKTIIVEPAYVDRDYLEDFAGYYVKCFEPYGRWCRRLHFFDQALSPGEFASVLRGDEGAATAEALQRSYLGFIVVKPLPETVVGRTCLKSYSGEGRRQYPIVRRYKVNLFGIPLRVDTLAFQEQDREVAACATSALWSVFQGTGILFQHRIPTPVEITKAATENEPSDSRNLPAIGGLSATKMARAIRSVSLEPFLVDGSDMNVLKGTIYGYLAGRVPLLLGVQLFDGVDGQPLTPLGHHAVAVTGFSTGAAAPTPHGRTGLLLEATRIDRLYAHDDQIGPFARMVFDGAVNEFQIGETLIEKYWSLKTSWRRRDGSLGMRAVPTMLIVPLYHKIRVAYETIEDVVRRVDAILTVVGAKVLAGVRLVWDVRLCVGGDLKSQIIEERNAIGVRREKFLTTPLPRFVWRATAKHAGRAKFDLLFDATDILQGNLLLTALEYDPVFSLLARGAAAMPDVGSDVKGTPAQHVFEWFRKNGSPIRDP